MSNIYRIILSFVLVMLIVSCGVPATATPSSLHLMDLRGLNLSEDNYSAMGNELLYATFDTRTKWPSQEKMPDGFDVAKILELGKDPGLGIRKLHDLGITGQGVSIAIIDQPLLVDHIEYKNQIRFYGETEDVTEAGALASMHASAVASIAVGKTIGVAPEADLYFIATGDCGGYTSMEDFYFSCYAKAIQRIVEINKDLPAGQKIRVLSMATGWNPQSKGYGEITAAVKEAKAARIFVISSNIFEIYGFQFGGLGREPMSNPNDYLSFGPGLPWLDSFYKTGIPANALLVPMDSRTTASEYGPQQYVFYRDGGRSWLIPYLAGVYALAIQVKPDIAPDEFWNTALKTGRTIQIPHNGKSYELGIILDPEALIDALQVK